jgi:hypothetical protein
MQGFKAFATGGRMTSLFVGALPSGRRNGNVITPPCASSESCRSLTLDDFDVALISTRAIYSSAIVALASIKLWISFIHDA